MGTMVEAECPCGFSTRMMLGGGMSNHEWLCAFPARCANCQRFEVVNLLDKPASCPACGVGPMVAYDDPTLAGQPGEGNVFSWNIEKRAGRSPHLSDGTYRCPRCDGLELRFRAIGMWD